MADSLGDRMKENYENRAKTYLVRRMPVIIRLDGKAFHTFTAHFKRPYDEVFHAAMNATTKHLCENIQGCKVGYTQSDEITLLLTDYDTLTTAAWFDYGVQKMCSVAASIATLAFNKAFANAAEELFLSDYTEAWNTSDEDDNLAEAYQNAMDNGAMFDARCFNIPVEEVVNCFIWRQQDATRNAIQMLGQCNFSYRELHNKSCNDIQDMLMLQKQINFNDMPTVFKRGVCCVKQQVGCADRLVGYKTEWIIDTEIPIFSQNREYIEKFVLAVKEPSEGGEPS